MGRKKGGKKPEGQQDGAGQSRPPQQQQQHQQQAQQGRGRPPQHQPGPPGQARQPPLGGKKPERQQGPTDGAGHSRPPPQQQQQQFHQQQQQQQQAQQGRARQPPWAGRGPTDGAQHQFPLQQGRGMPPQQQPYISEQQRPGQLGFASPAQQLTSMMQSMSQISPSHGGQPPFGMGMRPMPTGQQGPWGPPLQQAQQMGAQHEGGPTPKMTHQDQGAVQQQAHADQQQQQKKRGRKQQQQQPPSSEGQKPIQPPEQPKQQPQQEKPPQQPKQQPQQTKPPQQQPQSQQRGPQGKTPAAAKAPQEKSESPIGGHGDCLTHPRDIKPGTRALRKIKIESNHLALNVGSLKEAIHYDVTITPDTPKCLMRPVMMEFGRQFYPKNHPAFDGRKNLYSPVRLPFGPDDSKEGTVNVQGENRDKEFKVQVKFARTVDLTPLRDLVRNVQSPQDALQCLDIVLRHAPSINCVIAGRSFFTKPRDQIIDLGDGMEMYYGFYQSAIRGWKYPLLNVDVAHKAFPKASKILDIICELGSDFRYTMKIQDLERNNLDRRVEQNVEKFLRQLKIQYEIPGQPSSKKIYRVNGLDKTAIQAEFKLDNGSKTTVQNYFRDVKRVRLNFPHLPCLWVGARQRENKILLPMEYCSLIENQAVNRKMTENQTSAMIKKAATSTVVRKSKIMEALNRARYNDDACVRQFGFSVDNKFQQMEARVLEPPQLEYAGRKVIRPSRGVWRGDGVFFQVATLNKWTIAAATMRPVRGLEKLVSMMVSAGRQSGVNFPAPTPPFDQIGGRQTLHDCINFFQKKKDFDLIIVVVPNSGQTYSNVKKAAELNVGCLTQCLKERTLDRFNPQTALNILLKVNSKLNGINHILATPSRPPIMSRPCMLMGADVTHPSPDAKDIPSVAAVTASHDPKGFQYNICWRLQPPKVEIIEDLCNITVEQLTYFYKMTRCKPERIVFFRDGVSEGQFQQVQAREIRAIREACRKMQSGGDDYEPKITFLVVQKRHHTRFFPMNPQDSEDKNCNVPAGTCVDKDITNPTMQDFYLVSHASIQGVAKPTKYCTLYDDNDFSNDDIEALTYYLCHLFTRCNRSVSYPAPTYYAHLAAARAKVYVENDSLNMDRLQHHQGQYQIKECISKGKPMFFV